MNNKFSIFILLLLFVANNCIIAQIEPEKRASETDSTNFKLVSEEKELSNSGETNKNDVVVVENFDDSTFLANQLYTNAGKQVIIDTSTVGKKGNPLVATLCSVALPGLGQAYNKKYWKIPIIYTIFGSMYFFARNNHQKYKDFKFAYKNFETKQKPVWVRENVKSSYLKSRMNLYKRNRNFNIIVGGIFYLLNILDANVDAHLMDFDVSDDLSMRVEPDMNFMLQNNAKIPNFGLKFVFAVNTK